MDILIQIMIAIALSAGGIAFGAWLLPRLKRTPGDIPIEAEVKRLLREFVWYGISAAYRVSENAFDELDEGLEGLDKKAIADNIYDMLPDWIGPINVGTVKAIVSREEFETYVQEVFNQFDLFYDAHTDGFSDMLKEWLEEHRPVNP